MITRTSLDHLAETASKPSFDACQRVIDATIRARYVAGQPVPIVIDLIGVTPPPSDMVMGLLVTHYSKHGTGWAATWVAKGKCQYTFTVTPVAVKRAVRRIVPMVPERDRDRVVPWERPEAPYVWRGVAAKPGDGPMWCAVFPSRQLHVHVEA